MEVTAVPSPRHIGKQRSIGMRILLYTVTLGLYGIYWSYKTHEDIKRNSGQGVGGVLGLVIWIVLGVVSAFLIPSEIGKMYTARGKTAPVKGLTGLWLFPFGILLVPAIMWFVKVQGALNRHWQEEAAAQGV
jgi:uncharacterized BrkB/YihY/UPF0761 family membrane protein